MLSWFLRVEPFPLPSLIILSLYHHIRYSIHIPVLFNPSWSPLVLAFQTPSVVTGHSLRPFGVPFWPRHFFGAGTFSSSSPPGLRPFASSVIRRKAWPSRLPCSQCSLQRALSHIDKDLYNGLQPRYRPRFRNFLQNDVELREVQRGTEILVPDCIFLADHGKVDLVPCPG
jgi:hypothetical protein